MVQALLGHLDLAGLLSKIDRIEAGSLPLFARSVVPVDAKYRVSSALDLPP